MKSVFESTALYKVPVTSPQAAKNAIDKSFPWLADEFSECFVILALDTKRRVKKAFVLSKGSHSETLVDPRCLFRELLSAGAASFVCAHNHPSGDPLPSPEDMFLTRRLAQAGAIVGIEIVDHLVIGSEGYKSFAEFLPGYLDGRVS